MNYFKLFATLVKAMVKSLSTRQHVLTFEKESDNLWYIKMPWAGHHHNLQMVAGANHLLETFKSRLVTVRVSYEQKESTDICLTRQYYRIFGGATYKVSNLEGSQRRFGFAPLLYSYLVNIQNEFMSLTLRSNIVHKQERIVYHVYLSRDNGISR